MKEKLVKLLIIGGGVLGAFTSTEFGIGLSVVICAICGLALPFGLMMFTSVYGGKVWGIRVPAPASATLMTLLGLFGLVAGGYGGVHVAMLLISCLSGTRFSMFLICLAIYIGLLVVGALTSKPILEKITANQNNGAVLAQLPIFQEIDANMAKAAFFVVGFEGVALFSGTNYCYAVYRYDNFELGELSTPQEVALVGTYFCQKYHQNYTFKVDTEVIPGTPGQTVVAVGTGGIGVARIKGVPDQRLFRSYIFTRK